MTDMGRPVGRGRSFREPELGPSWGTGLQELREPGGGPIGQYPALDIHQRIVADALLRDRGRHGSPTTHRWEIKHTG